MTRPKNSGGGGSGVTICLIVVGIAIGQSNEWWGVSDWISGHTPDQWHFAVSADEKAEVDGSAILTAAQKYDNERYVWGGGHPPTSFKPGSGIDCSGLVDRAVYEATKVNENNTAKSFRNSKHWKEVPFAEAKAGDIMYRLAKRSDEVDHVVLVVSNGGDGKLSIFEASTSRAPVKLQVRQRDSVRYSEFDATLRFKK